ALPTYDRRPIRGELDRDVLDDPPMKLRMVVLEPRVDDADAHALAGRAAPRPVARQPAQAEAAPQLAARVGERLGPGWQQRFGHRRRGRCDRSAWATTT